MKRRKQNHKISFHFFSGSPHTPRRKRIGKEIFGFVHATACLRQGFGRQAGSVRGAQGWRWQALRAYDWVSGHHALGAWKGQSLRDWKKVRAKVNISAPNDSSTRESVEEPRACGAAKPLGGVQHCVRYYSSSEFLIRRVRAELLNTLV